MCPFLTRPVAFSERRNALACILVPAELGIAPGHTVFGQATFAGQALVVAALSS